MTPNNCANCPHVLPICDDHHGNCSEFYEREKYPEKYKREDKPYREGRTELDDFVDFLRDQEHDEDEIINNMFK